MQTKCLPLMGKKLLVALTLGKVAGGGLHDLENEDDMLATMARELVQKDGIGETADQIWSQLKEVYEQFPKAAHDEVPLVEAEAGFESARNRRGIRAPCGRLVTSGPAGTNPEWSNSVWTATAKHKAKREARPHFDSRTGFSV